MHRTVYRYEVVYIDTALTHTPIEIVSGPESGATACNPAGGNGYWTYDAGSQVTHTWIITIISQSITESAGASVSQNAGATTGTLTVALAGATTEIRITAAAGQTFVANQDLIVGSSTVLAANYRNCIRMLERVWKVQLPFQRVCYVHHVVISL